MEYKQFCANQDDAADKSAEPIKSLSLFDVDAAKLFPNRIATVW